ncbi:MAG: AI-2E family transporter [Planctomycetota bacterium]
MLLDQRPYTFDRVVRMVLGVGLLVFLVWLADRLSNVLVPFAIGFLIAYLLNPLVALVQRKLPNRVAATMLVMLVAAIVVGAAGALLIDIMAAEIVDLGKALAELVHRKDLPAQVRNLLPPELTEQIKAHYGEWQKIEELVKEERFWSLLTQVAPVPLSVLQGLGGLLGWLFGLTVIVMYVAFMLIDFHWLQQRWSGLIPAGQRPLVQGLVADFNDAMRRHFRAQAVVAGIVGLLFATGFSITGLPMAILFGLFVGLLNMVPYLQLASIPLAGFLALMQVIQQGDSLLWAFGGVAAVYILVQLIQDALLVPRIMGKAFGLRPVIILLAVMVWGELLGLLGLVIALPMTCLGYAWYQRLVLEPAAAASASYERPA